MHQQGVAGPGFGAMARHLPRLTDGLERALDDGLVSRGALALLQPRSPAISMTNAMQQTMGTRAHQVPPPLPHPNAVCDVQYWKLLYASHGKDWQCTMAHICKARPLWLCSQHSSDFSKSGTCHAGPLLPAYRNYL